MFRKSLLALALAVSFASSAQANTYTIDSRQSFLLASSDSPQTPSYFTLSLLGLASGDTVLLTRLGDYNCHPTCGDISLGMIGVFSSSTTVLGSNNLNRITGAIDAGVDITTSNTYYGNKVTDITQDFMISGTGTSVLIPTGALYLFVTAHDSLYQDNSDPDKDFGVSIEKMAAPVPEPETYAMMLAGLGLLGVMTRRRKQKLSA